jgi:hypothetical protein
MAVTTGIAWTPPQREARNLVHLLAVDLPEGQKSFSEKEYLVALTVRLHDLLRKEPDPRAAQSQAIRAFVDADLVRGAPRTEATLETAVDLVGENNLFRQSLRLRGLLDPKGWTKLEPSAEAATALRQTSLQQWLDLATPKFRDE